MIGKFSFSFLISVYSVFSVLKKLCFLWTFYLLLMLLSSKSPRRQFESELVIGPLGIGRVDNRIGRHYHPRGIERFLERPIPNLADRIKLVILLEN